MSEFKATASQRAAIDTRGSAVLVSAGAGSGKTKVLTERLMGYICDEQNPAELDSFLIITFTRAAAGELRGRISDEISARLASDPTNKRLRRQSALCRRAKIGTIHSFCADVLRENCHIVGLSPDFKIADDERAAAMKAAALERVMNERYDKPDRYPGFIELADSVGAGRDDRRLTELVINLHSRMQCHARPEKWAAEQVEQLKAPVTDAGDTVWGREILSWARNLASYWADAVDGLILKMSENEKISAAYLPAFSDDAALLRELIRRLDIGWNKTRELFPIKFSRLGSLRNSPDPELSELLKTRRDALKKDVGKIMTELEMSSELLLSDMAECAPSMEALLSLTLDFDRELTSEKRRRALVDYNDLEHLTAQLLTDENGAQTALARSLSERFTEIMVDEYQDVSRVQDAIFRAISKNGTNLFMVGDVKQSIYRFRLADPEIFTGKYETYKDYETAPSGEARRILLRENFRSRREILDAANAVFGLCMSRRLGDIDYDEAAALVCGAQYEGDVPKPELLILDASSADDDDVSERGEPEARLVARRIRQLIDSETLISDHGAQRPIRYGDIAILLRSPNKSGGVYRRVLEQYDIPVATAQGSGFFTSAEVSTMVSMLAVIDNPHQDIPLIAVLRSPCFGFTADELSEIRAADKKADFYTALKIASEGNDKCRDFVSKLSELRTVAPDLSAAELVWQLINDMDMLSVCSAMGGGEQRRANVLALIELAERFEASGYRGVHRFVLWLRRLAEKGQEISAGAKRGSAVQIMSVHKSKGLEFPVVFLCETARSFNRQDTTERVLVHPVLGLGPKYVDMERHIEYPTLARNAISRRLDSEMRSEEMRLLYVALTRPKERLFITATVKNAEKSIREHRMNMSVPMPSELLRQASCLYDWLLYSALIDGGEHLEMSVCPLPAAVSAEEEKQRSIAPDPEALAELQSRLSFVYPHEAAVALPSKVTATELKTHHDPDEDAQQLAPKLPHCFHLPDFAKKDRPVTGAERGVATHLVLQYMDFAKTGSLDEIKGEIERLRAQRFISDREAAAVDAEAIKELFSSPVGRRILNADMVKREFKFSVMCPAEKVYAGVEDEQLLLQGVIDCCIREGDALTVIDYKTDRVRTDAEIHERAKLYRSQVEAYAAALERIYGLPVRGRVLYFLSAGKAVEI